MITLVIGDAIIDRYTYANKARVSPEDNSIYVYDTVEKTQAPGGGLNVAASIAKLSGEQVYLSAIIGHNHRQWLKNKYHVQCIESLCSTTYYPLIKNRLIDSVTHKQVLRIDDQKEFSHGSIYEMERNYGNKCELLSSFDCIVVSDYCKGTITPLIIRYLENLTCPIFVDTKKHDLGIWRNIRNCYVKINEAEWAKATNTNAVNLIVTHGPNGATYHPKFWREEDILIGGTNISGNPVPNANVIGAGDAYLAGLVIGQMKHSMPIIESMRYADAAARASVRKFGTALVDSQDVQKELNNDDYRHFRANHYKRATQANWMGIRKDTDQ